MSNYYLLGDSNILNIKNKNIIKKPFISSSAMGLSNSNSITKANKRFVKIFRKNKNNIKILKFGQVDVEFIYYLKLLKNNNLKFTTFAKNSIQKYFDFILNFDTNKIIIMGIYPPSVNDSNFIKSQSNLNTYDTNTKNQLKTYFDNNGHPNLLTRTKYSKYYNDLLKLNCKFYNIEFIDFFDKLTKNYLPLYTNENLSHHIDNLELINIINNIVMNNVLPLISVIIPTYNRFKFLMNSIQSVKNQTYKNIEIIVVNDKSSEEEYYNYNWEENNIKIIHLEKNSQNVFGFACPGGYQRNFGMKKAKGKYIVFLDDDDIFLPDKIKDQYEFMEQNNIDVSVTEVLVGKGIYNPNKNYKLGSLSLHNENKIKFIKQNKKDLFEKCQKEKIFTNEYIKIANDLYGCSCMMLNKNVIDKVGYFPIKKDGDDKVYFENISKHYNIHKLSKPLSYIDWNHGYGYNYGRKNINKKR